MDSGDVVTMLETQRKKLREAKTHQGKRRTPLDTRTGLLSEYLYTHCIKDSQDPSSYTMRTTVVGDAYPPCLLPLAELQQISLKSLRLETHHRDSLLVVRTYGQPQRISATMNVVEDEAGDVDRLALYNTKNTLRAVDILPKHAVIAIKEPYYKMSADGRCTLRIDHPSDAVFLEEDHPLYPSKWKSLGSALRRPALAWKLDGNAALKTKAYLEAYGCYTRGLKSASLEEIDLRRDLLRNRAFVELALGRYDAAKSDAIASLSAGDSEEAKKLDAKALYRAGCAAYRLREFSAALEYFTRMVALSPSDEDGIKEIQRTRSRLEEQKGVYDNEAVAKAMPKAKSCIDHADFTAHTSIRETENRGRGLFATRTFHAGDLILCEKAFFAVHESDKNTDMTLMLNLNSNRALFGSHVNLWVGVVQKILDNPSTGPKILDLHAGAYPKESTSVRAFDELPVVDTFLVQSIIEHNTFGFPGRKSEPKASTPLAENLSSSTGLWSQASYMNHSCLFNAERSFIGDLMIVRATKNIAVDTEITIPYCNIDADVITRQDKLKDTWGFDCDCALCAAETRASTIPKYLLQIGESFVANAPLGINSRPSKDDIKTAERLVRDIERTYEEDLFQGMPHLAAIPIYEWLCQAHLLLRLPKEVTKYAFALLRSHGYQVTIRKSHVEIDRTKSILTMQAVDALMYISDVYIQQDSGIVAEKLKEMAKVMYQIINGVAPTFESRYGRRWCDHGW